MPSFNVGAALQAGYAPKEVLRHLASRGVEFPYEGSDEDIIRQHLAASGDKVMLPYTYAPDLDTPPPAATPLPLLASAPMSGPPASVPGSVPQTGERRNMSPQEIDALWSEQGITPTLPPLNAMDLAMLGLSGPAESTGLPPTLLQLVRYKKPGVSTLAREAAAAYHQTPRVDPIGAKNTVFHATDSSALEAILKAGEIVPNPVEMQNYGLDTWDQYKQLKPLGTDKAVPGALVDKVEKMAGALGKVDPEIQQRLRRIDWDHIWKDPSHTGESFWGFMLDMFGPNDSRQALAELGYREPDTLTSKRALERGGVSVSRVPRVASKGTKSISFVLDPEKMPPMRPYAESSYEKTLYPSPWAVDEYGKARMNPSFEFEDRTYNQAIPLSAAREMWVDKSAIPSWPDPNRPGVDRRIEALQNLAAEHGLPLRVFETGREMHAGRATLSNMAKKKRK